MLKLIILDVDGVMTDGRKYYDREGTVRYKTFCDKDWTAIKRFRALGLEVIFLTGDPFNVAIGENRKIDVIVNRFSGEHRDKSDYLTKICEDYDVQPHEIVFIGDDIFDVHLMQLVGVAFCPIDSPNIVKQNAMVIDAKGGENLIAKMYDYLEAKELISTGNFADHLDKVYELDLREKF